MRKLTALMIVLALSSVFPNIFAQTGPLSSQAEAIKQKAETLHPHDRIRLSLLQSRKRYGEFVSSNADSLVFYDLDVDKEATIPYAYIKKIKLGFGDYNPVTHRHSGPLSPVAFAVFLAVLLGAIVGAAAAAK